MKLINSIILATVLSLVLIGCGKPQQQTSNANTNCGYNYGPGQSQVIKFQSNGCLIPH